MKKFVLVLVSAGLCFLAAACSPQLSIQISDQTFEDVHFLSQTVSTDTSFAGALETVAHQPYINASLDMARPDEALTRAEAASIIYALLKEKPARPANTIYNDIPDSSWYQEMAESLASIGVLDLFGPLFAGDSPLSRVEFTVLLMQFFDPPKPVDYQFIDVPQDYWAYEEILAGIALGWFSYKKDSAFRPDAAITRGEAVTIVNRALGRVPDRDTLDEKTRFLLYIDLPATHWAYYDFLEASMPHEYHLDENTGGEHWDACYLPEAQREPGFHLVDGELYYVQENRLYAKNTTVGVLSFDKLGRYSTGIPELDQQLTEIVKQKTIVAWDAKLNLQVLYQYVCDNFEYWPDEMVAPGEEGWENQFAQSILEDGQSNCYGYAGLMTLLARKLGYQAKGVSGDFCTDFQEWTSHSWVELTIDGETLFCDPEIEGVYAPNRDLEWDLFLKRYGEVPTIYSVDGIILGDSD